MDSAITFKAYVIGPRVLLTFHLLPVVRRYGDGHESDGEDAGYGRHTQAED